MSETPEDEVVNIVKTKVVSEGRPVSGKGGGKGSKKGHKGVIPLAHQQQQHHVHPIHHYSSGKGKRGTIQGKVNSNMKHHKKEKERQKAADKKKTAPVATNGKERYRNVSAKERHRTVEKKRTEAVITTAGFLLPKKKKAPPTTPIPCTRQGEEVTLAGFELPRKRTAPPKSIVSGGSSELQTSGSDIGLRTESSEGITMAGFNVPVRRKKPQLSPTSEETTTPTKEPLTSTTEVTESPKSDIEPTGRRRPKPKLVPIPTSASQDSIHSPAGVTTDATQSQVTESPKSDNEPTRRRQKPKLVPIPTVASQDLVKEPELDKSITSTADDKPDSSKHVTITIGKNKRRLPKIEIDFPKDGIPVVKIEPQKLEPKSNQKGKRKKKKDNTIQFEMFPPDDEVLSVNNPTAHKTIEFDVFTGDWKKLTSDPSNSQIKISNNGAERTLKETSKAKKPTAAYTFQGSDSDSDDPDCIQYADIEITNQFLGGGTQGSVLKCIHRHTGKFFAIKKIDLLTYRQDELQNAAQRKAISRELSMLFTDHDCCYIIKSYNAFYRSKCLLILFEYMSCSLEEVRNLVMRIPQKKVVEITNERFKKRHKAVSQPREREYGPDIRKETNTDTAAEEVTNSRRQRNRQEKTLRDLGIERRTAVPEKVLGCISYQILHGLKYLHQLEYGGAAGIVHKDIKPANVLINDHGVVKLADFGCCSFVGDSGNIANTPFNIGTQMYMAPERRRHGSTYSRSSDIWSLGVMILELASGIHPCTLLPREAEFAFKERITLQDFIWPTPDYDITEDFSDFLGKCLEFDPSSRATAAELLAHPFINRTVDNKLTIQQQKIFAQTQLTHWIKSISTYETTETKKFMKREAASISAHLTLHAAGRSTSMSEGIHNWNKFTGMKDVSTSHSLDDLQQYPPLGGFKDITSTSKGKYNSAYR